MIHIAVDAMGGDNAPWAPIRGAVAALNRDKDLKITLTGDEATVRKELEGLKYPADRLEIRHTTEVIENEEHNPADAVRDKRDSSMVVACAMVKKKEADGVVSAGNTGALLSAATLFTGRIKGIQRPVLSVELPAGDTPTMLLDVGANMDAKTVWILQFARMSRIYMQRTYGIENPKIGLLNVGTEPGKGNEQTKEFFEALSAEDGLNFIGNVEAREALSGRADIIVADAFAGNVLLKGIEGTASYMAGLLKSGIYANLRGKLGGLLLKPVMGTLKQKLDPNAVGGTPLLGIDGAVIKAHGNSKETAFTNAILRAKEFAGSGINDEIREQVKVNKEL